MSNKKAATVAKNKKNNIKPKAVENDGFCVYIGPTITGVIQSGTVYRGAKAKVLTTLEDVVEKYPLVTSLVVEDATLSQDFIKVQTPGNALYVNYKKMLGEI